MLTEDEVRELLGRAAATIEVPPGRAVAAVTPGRPRWVVPAAAAAVVAIAVVAGAIAAERKGSAPEPAPPTVKTLIPVVGWDATWARQALEDAGLEVQTEIQPVCGVTPGRVAATNPVAGTRVGPGATVTLAVTSNNIDGLCVDAKSDSLLMDLMDLVANREPGVKRSLPDPNQARFSNEVDLYLNGTHSVLKGTEAHQSRIWGPDSALGVFAAELSRLSAAGTVWVVDPVGTVPDECAGIEPQHSKDGPPRQRFAIVSYRQVVGCAVLDVYRASSIGAFASPIDLMVVTTSDVATPPRERGGQQNARAVHAAQTFVNFAEGRTTALPVADVVELFVGNQPVKTIDAKAARQTSGYDLCPPVGYAERSCPLSAIETIRNDPNGWRISGEPARCADQAGPPLMPAQLRGTASVFLNSREPESCMDAWSVELIYNGDDQIVAVNLLLGSP